MSAHALTEKFLGQFRGEDEAVQKALGLPARATEIFFTALDYMEKDGVIRGLPAAMVKLKLPSPYLQELKKKGFLQNGEKRGLWLLGKKAVEKMEKMLVSGVAATADKDEKKDKTPKSGKTAKKKAEKPKRQYTKRAPKPAAPLRKTADKAMPDDFEKMTIDELITEAAKMKSESDFRLERRARILKFAEVTLKRLK